MKIKKKLRLFVIFVFIFFLASLISVFSYGLFVKRVQGAPGYALPVELAQTHLDKALQSFWDEHPGQTGLLLLQNGLDAFMLRAISTRGAGRSLDLMYYIWHEDTTGQLLDREILLAADRGVRVRLILDDMTAHGQESFLAAIDQHPNIEVRLFNPTRARDNTFMRGVETLLRSFSINRRMHNKAWIADGRIAVVGGRNIGDEYFDAASDMNFFDVDLAISGAAVAEVSDIFDRFWNSRSVIPLNALVTAPEDALNHLRHQVAQSYDSHDALPFIERLKTSPSIHALFSGQRPVYWTPDVHVFSDPPEKGEGKGKDQWLIYTLLPVWESAQDDFKIISPYFVPQKSGVAKFSELRERLVSVDILTNSLAANDVLLVHGGYAPYRKPLLEMGVALYEVKPFSEKKHSLLGSSNASLHTKSFLIDDQIAFVGSFNFDPRSVRLNTEMGILFSETAVVKELKDEFTRRTGPAYSYKVVLENGDLRWEDRNANGELIKLWKNDPESGWWARVVTKVISWLPIETQL